MPVHLLEEMLPTARAASFAGAAHVHYHWLLDPDQPLDSLRREFDSPLNADQAVWLSARLTWRDSYRVGAL